ncbi:MAG: DNA polymerase I [Candidatus Kerfeldbacteria bacterium]|nr:DNA polymerase I [Candidatus Kerfeldbacteria bacterium]
MPRAKQRLVIVDGNALIHRSFHALPPLTTKKGQLVNAVYGFTTVLLKMFRELKPTHVVVCFDRREKTFREKEYAEYKATRVKAPQELYDQIPVVKQLVDSFNIPALEKAGYEADDLIGTITKQATGVEKVIVTGDMDTLQLVDDETSVYTLRKGLGETVTLNPAAVKERFGITPEQLVDFKALRGDPSDNIPGVKGVGEKTAAELLQEFGTVEKLYEALAKETPKAKKLKPGLRQRLLADKQNAFLSKRLATIVRAVPIKFTLSQAGRQRYDRQQVAKLFQDLEFTSLLSKLPENEDGSPRPVVQQLDLTAPAPPPKKPGHDYELIADQTALARFLKALKAQESLTLDTETTSLDPLLAKLLGISFSWQAGRAYFVSLQGDWLEQLRPILERTSVKKHGHNLKFDYRVLQTAGIELGGIAFDSMVASYLLNPGSRAHGLKQLAFEEFGYEMMPIEALIGPRSKHQLPMESVPVPKLSWYSAEDADYTERLYVKLSKRLKEQQLDDLFRTIEMPLVPVLGRMEQAGVKVDVAFLKEMSRRLGRKLETIEKAIYTMAGIEFNVGSPQQLKEILFDKLKLSAKGLGKTKTGVSTAADQLEKLQGAHPIIPKIMEYRELAKLKSTYLDALPELVSTVDGRVHTTFNQTVAATGRLSSSDPNLQNIPIRTELGAEIRKAFIAERGFRIMAADYSQFELRIAASIAEVKKMIESFRKKEDIHARTAAEIHGIPLNQVTKEIRSTAKEVNFGVLYGMGPSGLAQRQGIPREKAQAFIEQYFSVYHELHDWLEEAIELARSRGYAETLFGRRRYLPELQSSNPMIRAAAERMAINMPIQGTQADFMKMAMIKLDQLLPKLSPESKMVLQVHDELVFEVPDKDVPKVARAVQEAMEGVYKLKVPFEVNVEAGRSWGETKPLGGKT